MMRVRRVSNSMKLAACEFVSSICVVVVVTIVVLRAKTDAKCDVDIGVGDVESALRWEAARDIQIGGNMGLAQVDGDGSGRSRSGLFWRCVCRAGRRFRMSGIVGDNYRAMIRFDGHWAHASTSCSKTDWGRERTAMLV